MWPFSRKTLPAPVRPIAQQVALHLKSFSLPEVSPTWNLYSRKDPNWLSEVAIQEGYNASAIVYAAVEKRAKLIAATPWKVYQNGEEIQNAHPLKRLLSSPNPDQSWYELIYEASQSLDLAGNAFISEVRGGIRNEPQALWLLPARYTEIKPGSVQMVEYYKYAEEGVGKRIDPQDMIHLKMPNPNDRWFGMPVLMAAGRATDIDRESGNWQKVSLQNRGVLDIHIEVPEGTTPEQVAEAKERYKQRQSGPQNARDPLFTSGKVTQFGQTAVELDFVESRKAIWTEIAAVFGVPLAALGFTEDVNLANAQAMEKQLWTATIIPQLDLLARQLNNQLAVDFGPDIELRYDLSNVAALQENLTNKLDNAERLLRLGFTRNEINERLELGFEEDPSGDTRYEPAGMLPVMDSDLDEDKAKLGRLAYG